MSEQARLPQGRYEDTIGQMPIGASGYTVPWAMWPDMDGNLWINGNYTIHSESFGTRDTLITRREDGYEVDVSRSGHRWSPGSGNQFVGGADVLPVIELHGA